MMKNILNSVVFMSLFTGCGIDYRDNPRCEQYAFMSFKEFRASVKVEKAKEIEDAGKIYVYGDTLLVNEKRKGIHVIDNRDKNNPLNLSFISVLGNYDIAVKDGYLMVDSFMDLVTIDINDLEKIKEVNRTKNIFAYEAPYNYGCNFDLTKGLLVGEGDEYVY